VEGPKSVYDIKHDYLYKFSWRVLLFTIHYKILQKL